MKMKRWQINAVIIGVMALIAAGGIFAITQIEKRNENNTVNEKEEERSNQWDASFASPAPSAYPGTTPYPGGFVPPVGSPMPSASVMPSVMPSATPTIAPSYVIPSGGQYDINLDWIYLYTLPPIPQIPNVQPSATNPPTSLPGVTAAPGVTQNPISTCTIAITCQSLVNNKGNLPQDKQPYVPSNGMILGAVSENFRVGETALDVLKRVCAAVNIPISVTTNGTYGGDYVTSLYQFSAQDCGSASGWIYKVNGVVSNVSAAAYQVKAGDVIEWCYTCDGGADIGGH